MREELESTITVPSTGVDVPVRLCIPDDATHLLIACYAYGLGLLDDQGENGRHINQGIRDRGVATLEFNLLTEAEQQRWENQWDWELLASRLLGLTEWVQGHEEARELTTGYLATSSGIPPVLRATRRTDGISCIISRGGRLDFSSHILSEIDVPSLWCIGSEDEPLLTITKELHEQLGARSDLFVIEGIGHQFSEEYNEIVSEKVVDWFTEI